MAQPDYQSARGSNAGDDFHELWVLRQALVLLDQDTELKAIAVEGLKAEDEKAFLETFGMAWIAPSTMEATMQPQPS